MAEAAATIGLIASITSLIDLGAKVVSRLQEFTSKTADVPESLRSLTIRLPPLTSSLRFVASQAQAGRLPDDVAKALQSLITSTATQVSILETYLSNISPPTDASRVQRAVKALESLAKEREIRTAVEKIHNDIDFLVLHQTTQHVDTGNQVLEELAKLQPAHAQSPAAQRGHHYPSVTARDHSTIHLGDVHYNVQLDKMINLDKLTFVKGAAFDAYSQVHTACHPATRVDLLRDIQDWTRRSDTKSIFWLQGMAGTGKSTISYTIAQWLTEQEKKAFGLVGLGASFFFKRGEGDQGSATLLFPTIIRQLAMKVRGLDELVAIAVDANPDICSKSLAEQFNKLVREPLQQLDTSQQRLTYVVVVDALDECDKETDIRTVLQLWSSMFQVTSFGLRLFLTSRPELPIRLGFMKMSDDVHQDMILHEVPRPIIKHDILTFLEDAFAEIREEYNLDPLLGTPLADDWPGTKTLQELTDMAVPLFILAATMYRFVCDPEMNPQEQLDTILRSQKLGHMSHMAQTYLPIVEQMSVSSRNRTDEERLYREFRTIVGSIVTLAEPLSKRALATLLDIQLQSIALRLKLFYSVFDIPTDIDALVRPLHLSFGEFLTSEEIRNQPFSVDNPTTHGMLLTKCLKLLCCPSPIGLCQNMCNLSYPGQPRRELASTVIQERLPLAVQYACRYWTYHAQHSGVEVRDDGEVHNFLQEHFLHWLEALSLLNCLASAIEYIGTLLSLVSPTDSIYLSALLVDARRFILANRYISSIAPLQLYSSAIIFAPQNSVVRNACGQVPDWIQHCPITPKVWNAELQKLEGHTRLVNAVAFSPDGSLLASGSGDIFGGDSTVRLWDATTGQEVQRLEGHTSSVNAVAFSPDGSLLASGSRDETVRLWDATTGQEVQRLEGHTNHVNAVAFSPDGSLLASGSWDGMVRLWDATTGQEVQRLEGHTSSVNAVAFSPDGSLLASGSVDRTVRLWDAKTGQQIQIWVDHPFISEISFAKDGHTLFTNRGRISVGVASFSSGAGESKLKASSNLVLKDDWIEYRDKRVLWLPHEYRSDVSAVYGNMLVLGRPSGLVSFIRIQWP